MKMALRFSFWTTLLLMMTQGAFGQQPPTMTWTGADPSGYWSAPANWSPAGVPVNGAELVFPGGLPPEDKVSTNDLTDSIFSSIRFDQASRHTIRGSAITLTNGISPSGTINHGGTNLIACDLTFSGTPSTPQYTIRGSGELTVIGNVGGGSLRVPNGMRLVIRGQFTGGSLLVVYGSTLALYGDNPYAVSAYTQVSKLLVQGSQPNLNITMLLEMETLQGSSLSGDGLVGDVTGYGSITLGSTLSVRNVSINGYLDIHLNGTNVGEYGRLVASGDVSLYSGRLFPSAGFNPQAGQIYTIVEKTSPGPITNAVFGPEGTVTNLNGMPFRISYVGGNGNDVTLTATPPRLNVARTSDPAQVRLFWSTNYPGFQLQRASSLDGSAPWSFHDAPMPPVVIGGDYTVVAPTATNHEFFRLKQE